MYKYPNLERQTFSPENHSSSLWKWVHSGPSCFMCECHVCVDVCMCVCVWVSFWDEKYKHYTEKTLNSMSQVNLSSTRVQLLLFSSVWVTVFSSLYVYGVILRIAREYVGGQFCFADRHLSRATIYIILATICLACKAHPRFLTLVPMFSCVLRSVPSL